ncbi:VOC family protein, partial [Salmonella enterica]
AVGGVMRLTPEMAAGGARPGWLFYLGVDDADATADAIRAAGGTVHMGPWTMPGVGRMAVVADPQGIPFYIMRGDSDASSTAY